MGSRAQGGDLGSRGVRGWVRRRRAGETFGIWVDVVAPVVGGVCFVVQRLFGLRRISLTLISPHAVTQCHSL